MAESVIEIRRVGNGWVIVPGERHGPTRPDDATLRVARTPGELAGLVTDWAVAASPEGDTTT